MNFREISIGETITDSLSPKEGKGYVVNVDANRKLTIDLRGPAGQDFDLYIKYNDEASTIQWDYKRVTAKADEIITISPTSAGSYYILVYAYRGSGQFRLSTAVPLEDVEIASGQQIKGTLAASKESLYYYIKSEDGQTIKLDLDGPIIADFDLYVRYGERPTNINYDFRSYSGSSRESITIEKARKGNYFIMVHSFRGSGDFTLSASKAEVTKAAELIITSKQKLRNKYGQAEFARIEARVTDFIKALGTAGISARLVYVDDATSLSEFGLNPVNSDSPDRIKELIDDLDRLLNPKYFLILGGHSIIPFHSLRNPAGDDGDTTVHSDSPYASRDSDHLIPERAMGRLPDATGSELPFFMDLISAAASRARRAKKLSFGMTASVWTGASQAVHPAIKNAGEALRISPPVKQPDVLIEWRNQRGYVYFNLHGGEDSANWYGQEGSSYPVAFSPDNIKDADVKNAVVCSEACYGANIVDKGVDDAISLKFLARNAACFVGSTKIAYGPADPPSTEADLLVLKFFIRIKEGITFGEAFMKAKQDFARESIAARGGLDGTEEKTLIEFVMFADPSSKMEEA
ncbi:MAG: hypothetical protein GKC09_11495 [Methanosarcinales archaeon]|nr:hypothetical protein [Methanosarcinales archaeon]